jgi:benzoyl-CoA 2,3-dioxygenase component B
MFVGESGVQRIVQRCCEVMREHDTDQVRGHGAIDLATIQKYINFHFSVSVDLFGQERSTNAANYYTGGIKGRFREDKIDDDHRLADAVYAVPALDGDTIVTVEVPALTVLNERLREDFIADSARGLARWNKVIAAHDIEFELSLPHRGFNRAIGTFADHHVAPDGTVVSDAVWRERVGDWLPNAADQAFIASLMRPVTEPGEMASWIAPPARGIDGQPVDYAYVHLT